VAVFEHSAGGVIMTEKDGQLLVAVLHTDKDKWVFPKGNIAENEEPEETAEREIKEEIGLPNKLELLSSLGSHQYFYRIKGDREVRLKRVHLFLFRASQPGALTPQSEEGFVEALWLPFNEVKDKLTFPQDKEALLKAKELWR
jgi:8-oxo-dGTP pyrophosphatase MutT (NUDIX family)